MMGKYQELRYALSQNPTPGPWALKDGRTDIIENAQGYPVCAVHHHPYELYGHGVRAAYISACDPDTIRELLDERDALREALVDNNKTLQAKIEELRRALAESQANDRQAMAYLNEIRALVGGNDFPDMVERVAKLQAENERLRCIISDLKDWDCDVSGGFLSIPVDLRRRIQNALAAHRKQGDSND